MELGINYLRYGDTQYLLKVISEQGTPYYAVEKELTSSNYNTQGSTTEPTASGRDAGTYRVYYYVPANDNYNEIKGNELITIDKADNPTTITAVTGLTYGTTSEMLTVSNKQGTPYYHVGPVDFTESNYQSRGSTSIPTANGLNAQAYTIYYYIPATKNYLEKIGDVTVTIGKANNPTIIESASENVVIPYGSTGDLINISNTQGEIYYAVDTELTSSNYNSKGSTDIPTAEGLSAGTYTVYYYIPATDEYAEKAGSVSVTITGTNPTNQTNPTIIDSASNNVVIPYGSIGDLVTVSSKQGTPYYAVDTVLTSDNYTTKGSTTIPTASGLNAGTYTVYYYIPATDDYAEKVGGVSVTIDKVSNPTTITAKTGLTYGTTSEMITVSNKQGTPYYAVGTQLTSSNYSSSGSTNIPTASGRNAGTYTVYYYIPATTNYTEKKGSVSVTIASKATNPTIIDSASNNVVIPYGSIGDLVTVSSKQGTPYYAVGTALTSSNYSSQGSTSIPTASGRNAGTYTIYYYIPATDDYAEKVGGVSVTISKVSNSTIITAKTGLTYGATSEMITVSNKQGTPYYAVGTQLTSSNYSSQGSTNIPTASGKNAGTHTVYYYIPATTNYTEKKGSVSVTIASKANNPTIIEAADNYIPIYASNGSVPVLMVSNQQGTPYYAVGTQLTSSNYSSQGSTTIPTTSETGAGSHTVYYYIPETEDYAEKVGSVIVHINN